MFGFRIVARIPPKTYAPVFLIWKGYTFDQFMRWMWYFEYRAALIKVQNPRADVKVDVFDYEAKGEDLAKILQNRIKGKKSNITKNQNKLDGVKAEFEDFKRRFSDLFPDENPTYNQYLKAISMQQMKVNRLIDELNQLENELAIV